MRSIDEIILNPKNRFSDILGVAADLSAFSKIGK